MKEFNKKEFTKYCIEFNRDKLAKAKSSVIWYEKEIKELKNSLAKFSYSKNNLDVILSKQRYVSNKNGLGYKSEKQQVS